MRFVGEGQHLFVATTITIGREVIGLAIWEAFQDAVYLLLPIAVGRTETARQMPIYHFYLCA